MSMAQRDAADQLHEYMRILLSVGRNDSQSNQLRSCACRLTASFAVSHTYLLTAITYGSAGLQQVLRKKQWAI